MQVAEALHRRGLWLSTVAVAVVNGGRKVEIEMDSREAAVQLLLTPLNINGQSVQMQEAVGDLIHVSLFNILFGFPLMDIKDELAFFGDIHSIKQQYKLILGRNVPIGTRIMKYSKIDRPIPNHQGGRSISQDGVIWAGLGPYKILSCQKYHNSTTNRSDTTTTGPKHNRREWDSRGFSCNSRCK